MVCENVKIFTSANFETDVLNSEQAVLVDFWAPWCGPCRMVAPVIDELAKEYANRVTVGKLNVDENGPISQQYEVMSIPTIGIFKEGKMVDKAIGFQPKSNLAKMLDKYL